ncbi:MAG: hypothetical protein ACLQU5_37010 [Isosphaeraceae bacterium]
MSIRSTQVGYRVSGIQPPDLDGYPDSVKKLYWGWVVAFGLEAKERDLARGLDKDGVPMRALQPKSVKYRRSEIGPTFRNAPPLEPSCARSWVQSLLTGRAHTSSAEFWWRFDSHTGKSFAEILRYQRDEYGRDVFGLSPQGTAWVASREAKRRQGKATAHVGTPPRPSY